MAQPVVHFEIMGTNGEELAKFYAQLFGWKTNFVPEMKYATVDTNGGDGINGGVGTTMGGGAPYVTFYVSVDDLQKSLDVIEQNGGKTVAPPMVIPNIVAFAQFSDPAGNVVGMVGPIPGMPEEAGKPTTGNGAAVSWFEALGPDADALADFYSNVFGWETHRSESPDFIYHEIHAEDGISGGIGSTMDGLPHVNVYAAVSDLATTLEKANKLGAKTLMPPTKVGEDTEIALFADPQGCVFGMYKHEH
ncbi:MAG: VOC family protein [Actinomycetota bacterium]|nr:VOC family protein [Actinomycetota bacterium]